MDAKPATTVGSSHFAKRPAAQSPAPARFHGAHVYQRLKAITALLVREAGGQEVAARVTRVSRAALGWYGNVNHETFAPADVIADLEAAVGEPEVTRELARLQGYELQPIPVSVRPLSWAAHLSGVSRDFAALCERLSECLEDDNDVDPDEAASLIQRVAAMQSTTATLRAAVEERADGARAAAFRAERA